jgi:mono/diheme cytochrome c family protein
VLKFLAGFAVAIVVILMAAFGYLRFGLFDPRADIPVSSVEAGIAMPSLDASVGRRAPAIQNPIQPTEANLTAGFKIYQANCASCHGDIHRTHGALAEGLYPRAPQFLEDAPDMPENQNYYIVEHGIRLSGMPAWKQVLSEQEIWQVTTFLGRLDQLPPAVSDAWKAMASTAPEVNPSPGEAKISPKGRESMQMH